MSSHQAPSSSRESWRQPSAGDFTAWVRRVNSRWLVHAGLRESAGAYLDYLEETDPQRLAIVSHAAWLLIGQGGLQEDPKPLFYGTLFGLATPEEEARFLSEHTFTLLASPVGPVPAYESLENHSTMSRAAYDKAVALRPRIAAALAQAAEG